MWLNLPDPLSRALRPLFETLPLQQAMTDLVVSVNGQAATKPVALVEKLIQDEALRHRPELIAGLWLYVDELDRSHVVSQKLQTPTGSFWHAIMHRREGDFDNSRYWYRRTGRHPAMRRIDLAGGGAASGTSEGEFDPYELVDRVQRAHARGERQGDLIALQHREWAALFEWCAEH